MKAIKFDREILIDGAIRVKAGEVKPLAELPVDHVASLKRLGYATEIDTPEPETVKPADKPAAKK